MYKALAQHPVALCKPYMVTHTWNPSTWEAKAEESEVQSHLDYIAPLRVAWPPQDPRRV